MYSLLRSADYNQADECFPADAIGRQCVPSCLMFLITASQILSCEYIQTADLMIFYLLAVICIVQFASQIQIWNLQIPQICLKKETQYI